MTDLEYKRMIHSIVVPATLSIEEQENRYQPLNDFLQNETPEKLYRFRQCNELNIDAFDKDRLFFSPGNKMNDDFDSMLYFDKEYIRSELKRSAESGLVQNVLNSISQGKGLPSDIQNRFPSEIHNEIQARMAQISLTDANKQMSLFQDFFVNQLSLNSSEICQIVQTSIKFACFSERIESAAMWGYYADDGKGFALAYDLRNGNFTKCNYCNKNKQCPSSCNCLLARVIYSDERFDASPYAAWLLGRKLLCDQGILSPFNNSPNYLLPCPDIFMHTKVLLHKAIAWSHEAEWRLTFSSGSLEMNQKEHPWAEKRPTALYLGRKISQIHEKILCHIAVEKNIPVYKMTIRENESSYKLYPEPI